MSLTLNLDPHGEQLVAAHLRTGRYHSPEEVVTRALETLAEKEPPTVPTAPAKDVVEAIERLKAFGKTNGLSLGGMTIRELRNEARP
jgi:hypothetical protein